MPLQKVMPKVEQSSCTEDRIQHVLERCLCGLGLDTPDKQLWNAGLCINRWCLEELVKRDPHNFLILLQKILRKTKEVREQCRYELVVPLTLLFSSTLLKAPHVAADCSVLQEAYLLFQTFLAWPEPCCSASKRLLYIIQKELRAPGISFQRQVRSEQGLSPEIHYAKTTTVLLVSPDEDVPPEVQSVLEQLSSIQHSSSRDVTVLLILHAFQAALGTNHDMQALHAALQTKLPEELEQLMEAVTDRMETAASTADPSAARQGLRRSMEKLRESLAVPASADGRPDTGAVKTFMLPLPKCHTCSWENDSFDVLNGILSSESDLDSLPDCFLKTEIDEDDNNDTSVDEEDEAEGNKAEFQNHRISTASSSSRDSSFSLSSSWSVSTPSGSSGVESDFSEETTHEDTEEGQDSQPKLRKKPKKKSRSILGVERFSLLFKSPRSPSICRRAQSMGYRGDFTKDFPRSGSQLKHSRSLTRQVHPLHAPTASLDPLSPRKHMCIRRRPILSCDEGDVVDVPTLVKVVVFGGDKEAGRLARAYSDLQQKESKCPRLTKTCKLQFYFVPTRRRTIGSTGGGHTPADGTTGSSTKAAASVESNGSVPEDSSTYIAQMLGMIDPWYERNVLSLLSLSSDVLCQTACKEGEESVSSGSVDRLPLLADLVLYYCRHADQPVLVQLYQAELTLAGGEKRREVFIHSLELGHSAGTRAVKAMGAASKRFGIDEEREAVPLTLSIAYNKVAVSGRSQWTHTEMVCTSINLHKACRKPEQLDSRIESLQLTMTEVLKRQGSKSKKGYNQHISISEVKVDTVQVNGGQDGTTFAVCLDQDEKKFIQSVTRCEVSLCCKPGSSSDWRSYKPSPGLVQPLHPSYCSLLCLPITSFSASHTHPFLIHTINTIITALHSKAAAAELIYKDGSYNADVALSAVEASLHSSVQALLKETSSRSASYKGMLRWSLQKKLEADPSCSASLTRVLVRELDKLTQVHETGSYTHAIPVLHTLYYVVIQSGVVIPTRVYQTVHECLMKLLILPSPYSAVALSTLRSIKMEMTTPGSLYQRRVTAEQNLRSEHFALQEKVFVLADPTVFSASLEAAVRSHLEASSFLRGTSTMQKNVVLRVLQTGLGTSCQSSTLAQALDTLQKHMVEKYFQEVVLAVETSMKRGAGGRANYLNKLRQIYRDILTASEEETTKQDHGFVCRTAMPFPEINFLLWKDEEDLWNLLADFATYPSPNSTSVDEEEKDRRDTVRSEDSGIQRDLKDSNCDAVPSPVTNPVPAFTRRNAFKNMKAADKLSIMREKIDMFPVLKEDTGRHTARVVVMGDDRVLGRLTRAYRDIRERESKHLFLTKKLNLQLYYIPVTSLSSPNEGILSIASLLGRVDPWYNSNINSLGAAVSKLPGMHSDHKEPSQQNPFLLDTLCYYLRCGTQQVNLPLYSVKMTCCSCDVSSVVEEVFVSHLVADISEFRHLKEKLSKESNVRRKKQPVDIFGSVISVSYKKTSLSKREVVKGAAPMTCGVVITSEPAAVTSGKDHLSVKFDTVNKGHSTPIQTQSISIRTLEDRTLSVCLDKDSRRTYINVQRLEISPCLDPRCSVQSKFSVRNERELLLSKYLDKVLLLPINTFSGVTL